MKDNSYEFYFDDMRKRVMMFAEGSTSAISLTVDDANMIIDSIRLFEVRNKTMMFPRRIQGGNYLVNSTGIRIRYYDRLVNLRLGANGLIEFCDLLADCVSVYNIKDKVNTFKLVRN